MSEPNNDISAFESSNIQAAKPVDYSRVINHLTASSLAGRSVLWPRAELVQPHKPSYFKPDTNLYRDTMRKYRRNGKELEYIHSAGTWLEQALCALDLFKNSNDGEEQGRLLFLLEESLLAGKEILAMRTSHFHAIITKGPGMARQLADLVETKVEAQHAQVQSESYASIYEELSAKYVVEAAKSIAKAGISNEANNHKEGPQGGGKGK